MAIAKYFSDNGETLWKVYVNVRSKSEPGVRVQRRLMGCKTEKEAQREEVRLIRECEREISEKESQGSTWGAIVEAWEKQLFGDEKVADITRDDYIAALKKHAALWWKRRAADITKADAREILSQMKVQGRSNNFQAKFKNIMNRVFIYGMENGLIKGMDNSPTIGIKVARAEEKRPEILTIGEIRKLLKAAREYNHPWYPIWAMALLTGMRSGELYALLWTDVDWENKLLSVTKSYNCRFKRIKSTKSGDWRTVPISSELVTILQEIRAQAGDRSYVLPRFRQWTRGYQAYELRKFCLGVSLPSVRFHTLRACFATQLIRSGVPAIQIQKVCGWKDLETMQRYIRLAGIEIDGVTEGLKVLPEANVAAQVVNLFTREPMGSGTGN